MGQLTTKRTRDARGYEMSRSVARGSLSLENFETSYDGMTDNLLSRRGIVSRWKPSSTTILTDSFP